jgi:hypothetical protein
MQPLILLLSSATVASATHYSHAHFHRRNIELTRGVDAILDDTKNETNDLVDRASDTSDSVLARVQSWTIPASCPWKIPWPLPDTPMPTIDNVNIPQLSLYPRPDSTANTLTIYNYCDYDLYFEPHVGNTVEDVGHISAGDKLDRPFEAAPEGSGVNLKVSKTKGDYSKPVQIEYAVSSGTVWYDISLIDCLGRTEDGLRNGDTSLCCRWDLLRTRSASSVVLALGVTTRLTFTRYVFVVTGCCECKLTYDIGEPLQEEQP